MECLFKPFSATALRAAMDTALRVADHMHPSGRHVCTERWRSEIEGAPTPMTTPVVFVVDDDVSVRESLEALIRRAGWKPETFSSAQAFLSRPREETPGCLVLDVELPDLNGLDRPGTYRGDRDGDADHFHHRPRRYPDERSRDEGRSRGVSHEAIRARRDVERDSARNQAQPRGARAASELKLLHQRHGSLTPREREVLAWVASGLLNKQVGAELGMTEATVKAHRGQVMQKMKADSLADLVKIVARLAPAALAVIRRPPTRCRSHGSSTPYEGLPLTFA